MKNKKPTSFASAFEEDVWKGLTHFPKRIPSKYIYDKKGDALFQKIMAMPSYYLTDCEFNILEKHQQSIAESFSDQKGFDLIELGAGDGKKTKILLRYLSENGFDFDYLPIDISQHILDSLTADLKKELPELQVRPLQGTYFAVLEKLAQYKARKKVILVLGSNIGNLLHDKAIDFLKNIKAGMHHRDMLFMGFDQKKDPQIILEAYNDKTGITAAFNKNLLERINRELDADFQLDKFEHWETYDPETGTARSYLISQTTQKVRIDKLDLTVDFQQWESLHIEISQKYTDRVVQWLAEKSGLRITNQFADDKGYYKNYVFQKK